MATKWLIGLGIVFMLGTVISNIIEFTAPIGDPETQGTAAYWIVSAVNSFEMVTESSFFGAIGNILWGGLQLIPAIFFMLLWDYSFFTGGWEILRWCFCFPISVGFVFSIIMAIRGTGSG